ncbi:hypothetical protein [Robiginitalea sp. SC105]|uniref:hypothetical protein n=1 Tax=Robiginitalea sp. SC105 TaxID=2762332 RepID=UPI00163B1DD3|nr:hypothetical protein [Robiginitalea sp. SC105]MBC2837810.1 hypothetical protein [Robiginitalea sp. SC105]
MKLFRILSILTFILTLTSINAQKAKPYKAWVKTITGTKVKGILYSADQSGLLLVDKNLMDTIASLEITNIDVLKVRKKGNIGRGAWIGAASGALMGAVLGYAEGDAPPDCWLFCQTAEEKALMVGIVLTVPGTGIGALIGTGRKKYLIGGAADSYLPILPELQGYALH